MAAPFFGQNTKGAGNLSNPFISQMLAILLLIVLASNQW